MIRKFLAVTSSAKGDTISCKIASDDSFGYTWSTAANPVFFPATRTFTEHLTWMVARGWKEVKAGIDPNDLQGLDQALWGGKQCCPGINGNGPTFYKNGAWHQGDCTEMTPATTIDLQKDFRDEGSKKGICTCGSAAVGSDRHSHWCDVK